MPTTLEAPNKQFGKFIVSIIDKIPLGTPIFTDEVTEIMVNEFKIQQNRAKKIVNTNLNRLNGTVIENFRKGIYYKPKVTAFGKSALNPTQVILKKYLKHGEDVVGYETGASLILKLGLSTQVPKYQYIATNLIGHRGNKVDDGLKVVLRIPKMIVTKENFKYLQVLDAVENRDNVIIDSTNPIEILNEYIVKNQLDFGKLIAIAMQKYKKEVFLRVAKIAEETRL